MGQTSGDEQHHDALTPAPSSARSTSVTAAVLALTAVGLLLLVLATRPQPVEITILPPAPTATPGPSATPAPVTVYITGQVGTPGTLYTLPAGSRVEDVILAAGGLLADADTARVNRAATLRDGDHIHVPAASEPELPSPTPGDNGLVNVNIATMAELTTLPGIGPVTAAAILTYRENYGLFPDLASLDAVNGIGPATLDAIAERVTFE